MSLTLSGSGTVTGLTAGGLPDASVTSADIANANVTQAKLAAGVTGNGPAFSAYPSATTALSNGAWTKIAFNTKEYDTNSNYDTTNYRFTPTVAGYYQINGGFSSNANGIEITVSVYKNGTSYKQGIDYSATNGYSAYISTLIYLNGSTDYVEIFGYIAGAGKTAGNSSFSNYFNGALVRAA